MRWVRRPWYQEQGASHAIASAVALLIVAVLLCAGLAYNAAHPCEEYGPEHMVNTLCPVIGGKETLWIPCVQVQRDCLRRAP